MSTQTIFQAGNSSVVAIPKDLMRELKLKKGQKVIINKSSDGDAIMINKVTVKNMKMKETGIKTSLTPEFKQWLDKFVIEYKDVLSDLSKL